MIMSWWNRRVVPSRSTEEAFQERFKKTVTSTYWKWYEETGYWRRPESDGDKCHKDAARNKTMVYSNNRIRKRSQKPRLPYRQFEVGAHFQSGRYLLKRIKPKERSENRGQIYQFRGEDQRILVDRYRIPYRYSLCWPSQITVGFKRWSTAIESPLLSIPIGDRRVLKEGGYLVRYLLPYSAWFQYF